MAGIDVRGVASDLQGANTAPAFESGSTQDPDKIAQAVALDAASDILGMFAQIKQKNDKAAAEKARNDLFSNYINEQNAIANDTTLSTMQKNMFLKNNSAQFLANNPQYAPEIKGINESLKGASLVGDVYRNAQAEENQHRENLDAAQDSGFVVPIVEGSDQATQRDLENQAIINHRMFERSVEELNFAKSNIDYSSSVIDFGRKQNEEAAENAFKMTFNYDTQNFSNLVNNLAARTDVPLEERITELQLGYNKVKQNIGVLGQDMRPSVVNAQNRIIDDLNNLGKEMLEGKLTADSYQNQLKELLAKQQLAMAQSDDRILNAAAGTRLLGDNVFFQLTDAKLADNVLNFGITIPEEVPNKLHTAPEVEKQLNKSILKRIEDFQTGRLPLDESGETELRSYLDNLSQGLDASRQNITSPSQYAKYVEFFKSPQYLWAAKNGYVSPALQRSGARILQDDYATNVRDAVQNKLASPIKPTRVKRLTSDRGLETRPLGDFVTVQMGPKGVTFAVDRERVLEAFPNSKVLGLAGPVDNNPEMMKIYEEVNELNAKGAVALNNSLQALTHMYNQNDDYEAALNGDIGKFLITNQAPEVVEDPTPDPAPEPNSTPSDEELEARAMNQAGNRFTVANINRIVEELSADGDFSDSDRAAIERLVEKAKAEGVVPS